MELVEKHITAQQIITDGSIRNAIKICLAMSGSTNAVMHLTAMPMKPNSISMYSRNSMNCLEDTAIIKINPASEYNMIDFYRAGGSVNY